VTDIQTKFGIALRRVRLSAGLSQEDLAHHAGIHRTYVSSIELGKVTVGLDIAQRLAAALGMPLSQLILNAEHLQGSISESMQ
jgi:transcriptional regulator with XRE-family HTH domain